MVRTLVTTLIGAGTLITASASPAADKQVEARYTPIFNRCISTGDAQRGVTTAVMTCLSDEHHRQDARLNRVYKTTMGRLNASQKATLRTAQRQWLRDTEARCNAEMKEAEGGTLVNITFTDCELTETIKRTIWLENYRKR